MSPRTTERPRWLVASALGLAAFAAAIVVVGVVGGAAASQVESPIADGSEIALAPIVAAWPDGYSVTGTKSEPLYVEHITSTRDGNRFSLVIDVVAQGDSPLGVQHSEVRLQPDGAVRWTGGCTKTAAECLDDPGLRGFLSQAAVLGAIRRGVLSADATGTARTLHGHPVVCVSDAALHPDAPPVVDGLDPCFSISTGALLGHWSTPSAAFVGPTLAEGLVDEPR
ncbi:hypothetical protein [Herbiconiux ginsengi]|uniref:Uncharacterized protein n=1 Tax=Herbiconiux ginsengi TaxID=381665 RepID=A0A1H3TVU7_9MICO|nr:hypothetical protein [Herbiconiux ginsengi]SDZ54344.1 hypothetical protein SAMN05216554_4535 [Herbiconiux ginsengi]